jgi:hypothetical protein
MRQSRPAHHRLTNAEIQGSLAIREAQDQRDRANGFLIALCLAVSPAAVPLAIFAFARVWGL